MTQSETKDRRLQFWAFMALLFATVISYGLLGHYYVSVTKELERQNADLLVLAEKAREQALDVQQQRRDTIRRNCEAQNTRHKELEDFILEQGITPQESPVTYQFLDKLVPRQDCDLAVKLATTTE